jgi:predicted aldo/keto reductase-like oxidoreductase
MSSQKINRRRFIQSSSAGLVGAGLAGQLIINPGEKQENVQQEPRVREYRTLGRTGFRVSDISSGAPSNEAILRVLLDAGVNFIDTGEQYGNGNNERLIAKVLKDYDRKKIFILDKIYTEKDFGTKDDVLKRVREALDRLETEYIDCLGIHSVENTRIVKDEAFHAAALQLKQEGRVKYVGASCHGNNWLLNPEEDLEKVLMAAIEDGRFDLFLLAYNFVNSDMAEKVMNVCEQKGIGTAIMKANPVQLYMMLADRIKKSEEAGEEPNEYTLGFYEKYKTMTEQARDFFKGYGAVTDEELMAAATRFVLNNPKAHTICFNFNNFNDVQTILGFSGQRLTLPESALLENYREAFGHLTCRIGCNTCESACPHHLPVGTIMRYNYYFEVKKHEREAMEKYARLPGGRPHILCQDCPGYCEQNCPYGVSTRAVLAAAHLNLSWAG